MGARQIYRLNPPDIGQPRGLGISVLFNNGNDVFKTTTTTKEQVKSNLINYVLTNRGERFFNPEFGGDIRRSLFEQNDDSSFDDLITRLENDIPLYIPNIILQSIDIRREPDYNLVNIIINYQINQDNEQIVINIQTKGLINLIQ